MALAAEQQKSIIDSKYLEAVISKAEFEARGSVMKRTNDINSIVETIGSHQTLTGLGNLVGKVTGFVSKGLGGGKR